MLMTKEVFFWDNNDKGKFVYGTQHASPSCSFRGSSGKNRRHLRHKAQVAHSGPLKRVLGFFSLVDLRNGGPASALVLEPLSAGPLSGPKLRPDMSASIPLQYSWRQTDRRKREHGQGIRQNLYCVFSKTKIKEPEWKNARQTEWYIQHNITQHTSPQPASEQLLPPRSKVPAGPIACLCRPWRQPWRSLCRSCAGSRGSSLRTWCNRWGPFPGPEAHARYAVSSSTASLWQLLVLKAV